MTSRKVLILSGLFLIGVISFVASVLTDSDLTWRSALLALGTEGLKTAVLFVLIDYLIGDHERRLLDANSAREKIKVITSGEQGVLGDLLKQTVLAGGAVQLDLTQADNCSGISLSELDWHDSTWQGADLSGSDFRSCRFSGIEIQSCDLANTLFERCVFKNVSFGNTMVPNSLFSNCEFLDCQMSNIQGTGLRFSKCEFWAMREEDLPPRDSVFSECLGIKK